MSVYSIGNTPVREVGPSSEVYLGHRIYYEILTYRMRKNGGFKKLKMYRAIWEGPDGKVYSSTARTKEKVRKDAREHIRFWC
jgi:hypothetical protein